MYWKKAPADSHDTIKLQLDGWILSDDFSDGLKGVTTYTEWFLAAVPPLYHTPQVHLKSL